MANDFPLAYDIPLATLQAKNIQVKADWKVVDDDANNFDVKGGILMLTSNISGAGYPEGNIIIATVEVVDKFSTLNESYQDLTVRVMITAVIMGCRADGTRNFARDDTPNRIKMDSRQFGFGVIAHRYTLNGYNNIDLYTYQFEATFAGGGITGAYITTSPTGLYDALTPTGYTEFAVNESADCFAEEVNHSILAIHAPFITGELAGEGRAVTVASALVSESEDKQIFSLDNVELANALNELYPIKAINDDGKGFRIDGSEPKGDTYEYYANITGVGDSVQKNTPHEVIVLNNCPPVVTVIAWKEGGLRISTSDVGKVGKYMVVNNETIHTDIKISTPISSAIKGVISHAVGADGLTVFGTSLADGDHPIKFADHFLCGTE
ncbi:MAG: hypothetical protein ACR2PV_01685 [Gammaproteobacteria bacterium]